MSKPIIEVQNLSKLYELGPPRSRSLKESAERWVQRLQGKAVIYPKSRGEHGFSEAQQGPRPNTFWALKDVSFSVEKGEVVGIIGRNGAGKSTLLKILSRITEPTSGRAILRGRVASLLEVGTGFHPDLTGRENVYLNGAILGMRKWEIDKKFDEIAAFAEVEKFIDTPVKHYSSGMYVRLAFAVAAHLDPEILLVDEVLAVGDAAFQKKCLGKMNEVAELGRTVFFVSHNMGAINGVCSRTLYLKEGSLFQDGPSQKVIASYMSEFVSGSNLDLRQCRLANEESKVYFQEILFASNDQKTVHFGESLNFRFKIMSKEHLSQLTIGGSIFNATGICVGTFFTKDEFSVKKEESIVLNLTMPRTNLSPGVYYGGFSVGCGGIDVSRVDYDVVIGLPAFQVLPFTDNAARNISEWQTQWGSIVFLDHKLEMRGHKQ